MSTMLRCVLAAVAGAGSLAAQAWTQLTPGGAPAARDRPGIAYDQRRDRVVIFGGANSSALFLGDSWEFDGATWTAITVPVALGTRIGPGMAYDHVRGKVVLYGGSSFTFPTDTWQYDGAWIRIVTAHNPGGRQAPAMTWDAARGRVVLFGGAPSGTQLPNDTWEFDGVDWQQVVTPAAPPGRRFGAMAYDASRGRCVLFGGDGLGGVLLADTWEYDGTTWTQVPTAVTPPARNTHALAYDVVRGRMVLFGGSFGLIQVFADQWEFDGVTGTWTQVTPQGPPVGRTGPGLCYDVARRRMILFGGRTGAPSFTYQADTWEFTAATMPTWTRHGLGCAGSAGVPTLDPPPGALPVLGTNWLLTIGSLPASPGLLLIGFGFGVDNSSGAPLPLDLASRGMPGCKLWIEPGDVNYLLPHIGGSSVFPLVFPAIPALAGTLLATQALVLDAAAANGVGAVSNGGILLLR